MPSDASNPPVSDVDWANAALLPVVGKTLSQFTMWGFGLHLDFGDGYVITVEAPLSVTVDGESWEGEPASGGSAAALLKVVHNEVLSATVLADGGLRIATGHAMIEVPSLYDFEAWHLNAPGHVLVVCMPGGGIACFPGDQNQPECAPS